MAYYGPEHRARLELVTAMQTHGYTLSAIERHLAAVELDASAEEIELQGSLLKAWAPAQWEELDQAALEQRAGRKLTLPTSSGWSAAGASCQSRAATSGRCRSSTWRSSSRPPASH